MVPRIAVGLSLRQGTSAATGHGPLFLLPHSPCINIGTNEKIMKMYRNLRKNRIRHHNDEKNDTINHDDL